MHPLRLAWGHSFQLTHPSLGKKSLTYQVSGLFGFLFKIVLKTVVGEDTSFIQNEILQSHKSVVFNKQRSQEKIVGSSEKVIQQIFEVLFSNVERYLDVLSRFSGSTEDISKAMDGNEFSDFGPKSANAYEMRESCFGGIYQDPNDRLFDDKDYFKEKGGESAVKSEIRH